MEFDGLRVWVTAARKGRELTTLLERRGADVTWVPTLAADRPADDLQLLTQIDAVLAAKPRWVVASTGVGMRAWIEAARRHGREERLLHLLRSTTVAARGSKARGALRQVDVTVAFVSPQETDADVADWLHARLDPGDAVAVQHDGVAGEDGPYRRLAERDNVRLLSVAPYRCTLPRDLGLATTAIRQLLAGELDLVVCTSAPAARNLIAIAADLGLEAQVAHALTSRSAAAAVGPVTAAALEDAGIPVTVMPTQPRTGELVRAVASWWARRGALATCGPGIELTPAGRVARVGTRTVVLGEVEFGVLAALVRRPHVACSPQLLAREAWGHRAPTDPSAIKHPVARLRRKLGAAAVAIQTVANVGYRYSPGALGGRAGAAP
ncbi:MAG TPA: uroporphyrinogen-III synthase [Nitriliruptorales bacterium]|nr:uroporphyrinogen-III synthase [Nitriliruptorales bacterium]